MTIIEIKGFGIDDLTEPIFEELKFIFDNSNFNSKMYGRFREDVLEPHEVFKAYLAYDGQKIVGIAVVEDKIHKEVKHLDYLNHKPIHLKRFTVHPDYRSQGIGKKLLDEAKNHVFNEVKQPVLFGESNETGAISFYGREGALYSRPAIEEYSTRNSAKENLYFFTKFITDKDFRLYVYQTGKGLPFVFCDNQEVENQYRDLGFISKDEMIEGFSKI